MAARAGDVGYDQLHHFVAAMRRVFLSSMTRRCPRRDVTRVAPQYASSLGKTANCQSLVSVTLASREVPVMVGLRLFLPESWTDDPERMARARVPKDRQTALTKRELRSRRSDRVIASGARFGCVLADSRYGSSGPFRQALSARGLLWAVGLSRRQRISNCCAGPAQRVLLATARHGHPPRPLHPIARGKSEIGTFNFPTSDWTLGSRQVRF